MKKYKHETNLPELHNKFPFGLSDNHEERNHNRIAPKYPVKYLKPNKKEKEYSLSLQELKNDIKKSKKRHKHINKPTYIGSVFEGANSRENVDSNAEKSSESSQHAETFAYHQKRVGPRPKSGARRHSRYWWRRLWRC